MNGCPRYSSDIRGQPKKKNESMPVSTAFRCGFNWSLQHLDSIIEEKDVADGIPDEDLLYRSR